MDYDKFKFLDKNRTVKTQNLDRITDSMSRNNLLSINPIICNSNFVILDGQHRFLAAKKLGVAIYYTITDLDAFETIETLNSAQEKWNVEDYMRFHFDNPNVRFIKKMCETYGFSVPSLIRIFSTHFKKNQKITAVVFKEGLVLNASYREIEEFCLYHNSVLQGIPLSNYEITYFKNRTFTKALYSFYHCGSVDKERLKEKICQSYMYLMNCRNEKILRKCMIDHYNKGKRTNLLKYDSDFRLIDKTSEIGDV